MNYFSPVILPEMFKCFTKVLIFFCMSDLVLGRFFRATKGLHSEF